MSYLDRTGEPIDLDGHSPDCCGGWLGEDSEGRRIPCLHCKPHLVRRSEINDYDPGRISARARAAIERADRDD